MHACGDPGFRAAAFDNLEKRLRTAAPGKMASFDVPQIRASGAADVRLELPLERGICPGPVAPVISPPHVELYTQTNALR